ncbi:Unknown protein [Striga hermonthica]|uniref:Flowering time control protein FCA n=1 Tax=Striga hermonthica TaxID=68872 RepID=A0A9N7RKL4_STRHE|nr:Unknown protein [Striga hermonthica]
METNAQLSGIAAALNLLFEFHLVVDRLEDVRRWMLHMRKCQTVAASNVKGKNEFCELINSRMAERHWREAHWAAADQMGRRHGCNAGAAATTNDVPTPKTIWPLNLWEALNCPPRQIVDARNQHSANSLRISMEHEIFSRLLVGVCPSFALYAQEALFATWLQLHRGGDRYTNGGEEPRHYNSSGRKSRDGGSPFRHHGQDSFRNGGGRSSPRDSRDGFSVGGGGGRAGDGGGRENQRAFDSPPMTYPQPLGGEGGVGGGGLRPIGDGIVGFRPVIGGPTGGGDGRGFPPMGSGGRGGFRPISGGRGDEFQRMGGAGIDGGDFQPLDGPGGDGRGFRQMGGPGGDGGGFRGGSSDSGGFRPVGSDGGRFGLDEYREQMPPLTGQKRGYPFSGRERSPGREGASFAKLFVGSVPRTATEDDVRPLFDNHGRVLEVALIKDKRTGQQQGCCFIKYATSEEADRAIRALHNQYTLPGAMGPIQVRYADGERERLGATEFKLFVGSLNRQATEKEVEEIFSPYGRVEDVYLMRDEMKQSRGCGFVKYSQRDMAQAAINALNGTFTMRGCDQPLTVRFADPKRPRPGDSRSGPSFGGPAFGPRFPSPAIRPPLDHGAPLRGPVPSNWPPVSPHSLGPSAHVGNQIPASSGDMSFSSNPGPLGNLPGKADGSLAGPTRPPLQSQQNLPPSAQVQPLNSGSFSSLQSVQGPYMQPGKVQTPQQLPGQNGQFSVPPTQGPQGNANQQLPPPQKIQSPSHLAQMLSQQKHNLQATFQSSQQAFNQLQQQVQQLQPTNQNLPAHQISWSQPVANTSAGNVTATTPASATNSAIPTVSCKWTEHTSPDGYKYYYNSLTGESKWEKPEELILYEQQQQQKPSNQHPQVQTHQMQVQFQGQYGQLQNHPKPLQQSTQTSYQVTGFSASQSSKEHGYGQIPAETFQVTNPTRNQQGIQEPQEWMWKNNN